MSEASVDLPLDVFATMSEMERMGAGNMTPRVVEAAASFEGMTNGEGRSAYRISFRIVAKRCSRFFSSGLVQHFFFNVGCSVKRCLADRL